MVWTRVLRVAERHRRDLWVHERSRTSGLRHELVPDWAKDFYADLGEEGLGRVPHRKYQRQADNHHPECYAMAVLAGQLRPLAWQTADGSATAPPAWLDGPHECLYECFSFLYGSAPTSKQVAWYGESVLAEVCEPIDGRSPGEWLREAQQRARQTGATLGNPDLIALPRAGGPVRFIEVKGQGDTAHRQKNPKSQVNALHLLHALGVEAELWYVLHDTPAEKAPPPPEPALLALDWPARRLVVRPGVDFPAVRARAAASIPRSSRRESCETWCCAPTAR